MTVYNYSEEAPFSPGDTEINMLTNDRRIEMNFTGRANIQVYTLRGILLFSQEAENGIAYPAYESGVYIVCIHDKVQKVWEK